MASPFLSTMVWLTMDVDQECEQDAAALLLFHMGPPYGFVAPGHEYPKYLNPIRYEYNA
jgi:hypothetical protein